MSTVPHILIIDDDREIRELLGRFLETQGFRTTAVRDGMEARRIWQRGHFSLVVLDLMLPGETGLDIAGWLRREGDVPIIMLTAMSEETDRIVGLELGADDYVTKPFNPRELAARIRAVLRRSVDGGEKHKHGEAQIHEFNDWRLEPGKRRLTNRDGAEVVLTAGEFDLLVAMVERPNRVLTREMLLDLLHGRPAGPFDRAIDVAVSRLRRRLEDTGEEGRLIKTVRGGGYIFAADVTRR